MAESEEELKNLLMKVKEESEKGGFKFNIQKAKIMTSSPITSWQIEGENVLITKKKRELCDGMETLTNAMAGIILSYIIISSHHAVHLKLIQCYMSIISQ